MDVLGKDGQRVVKTDEELRQQEAYLKAKIMSRAQAKGFTQAAYKGKVHGPGGTEDAYGDWTEGLSDGLISMESAFADIAKIAGKPSLLNGTGLAAPSTPQQIIPQQPIQQVQTFTPSEKAAIERMGTEPVAQKPSNKKDTSSMFGF